MADVLVTGGTGFVGANVVRELLDAGVTVRVLARAGSDRRALGTLPVEIVEGDLCVPASLRRAVAGVTTLFHVADASRSDANGNGSWWATFRMSLYWRVRTTRIG